VPCIFVDYKGVSDEVNASMFNVEYIEGEVNVFFRNYENSLRNYRAYYARSITAVIFSAFRTLKSVSMWKCNTVYLIFYRDAAFILCYV